MLDNWPKITLLPSQKPDELRQSSTRVQILPTTHTPHKNQMYFTAIIKQDPYKEVHKREEICKI